VTQSVPRATLSVAARGAAVSDVRAITLFRVGNAYEADTLVHLGAAYAATGRHDSARDAWHRAIDLYLAQHRPSDAQHTKERMASIDAGR
jgi:Flp pilus assembly protein TadD